MKQANNHMNALEMLISNISSRISSATDQKVKLTLTKLVNRISVQEVLSSDNLKNIQKLLVNINDDLLDELDTDEQRVQYKKYFDAIFYSLTIGFQKTTQDLNEQEELEKNDSIYEENQSKTNQALNELGELPISPKKSKKTKKFKLKPVSATSIVISYRDEAHGNGAFYDHYTLQRVTKHKSCIAVSEAMFENLQVFHEAPYRKKHRLPNEIDKTGIKHELALDFGGLLVIPGRSRDIEKKRSEVHQVRTKFEKSIIKKALLQGRPILAMCAGSWQLWNCLGGKSTDVVDHNYGAGMPLIKENGDIGKNKQIHGIKIEANTLLAHAMGNHTIQPTVNSVHWQAPDITHMPQHYICTISAKTVQDDKVAPESRQSVIMKPTKDSVEAFEVAYGAPVMGIQWHPEAYNDPSSYKLSDKQALTPEMQVRLLIYMAQAGDAYAAKQRTLKELKIRNQQGFFKPKSCKKNKSDINIKLENELNPSKSLSHVK